VNLEPSLDGIDDPVFAHTVSRKHLHFPAAIGCRGRRGEYLDRQVGGVANRLIQRDEMFPGLDEEDEIRHEHVVFGEHDVDRRRQKHAPEPPDQ
jgi:hypothetical protein